MMKKRELFGSLVSSFKKGGQERIETLRPPYFEHENSFVDNCLNCDGKCALVCEENIISIWDDKTPILDFSKGGCIYCDKCAQACEFDVLHVENKKNINAKITINVLKCISWDKTMCFSCKELCLEDAINFLGLFRPEIDMEKCTSCGFV
ncbi:MAG: ferredoxin-type protein NapF [Campylobacteraceae bacterium]|nr:ferredoxin-type protein NapF [Campylobacteraceae bacterium]